MDEKKSSKYVNEIFQKLKTDTNLRMKETENYGQTSYQTSFNKMQHSFTETNHLFNNFTEDKSNVIDKSIHFRTNCIESYNKELKTLDSIQLKLNTMDNTKDLVSFGKDCLTKFQAEVKIKYSLLY